LNRRSSRLSNILRDYLFGNSKEEEESEIAKISKQLDRLEKKFKASEEE